MSREVPRPGGSFPWRGILLVALVGAAAFGGRALGAEGILRDLQAWAAGLGPAGPAAFAGVYAAGVVLALPGLMLTAATVALFGLWPGFGVVSVGSTAGAGLAFLVSRYVARDPVRRWLSGKPAFERLDRLTRSHGVVVVAVTRLVPLFPFNLLNYGFGLTGIRFGTYLFWSWLCMLPGTLMYIAGMAAASETAAGGFPKSEVAAFCIGTVAVLFLSGRAARALQERERAPK